MSKYEEVKRILVAWGNHRVNLEKHCVLGPNIEWYIEQISQLFELKLPENPYHYPQYTEQKAFNEVIQAVKELNK